MTTAATMSEPLDRDLMKQCQGNVASLIMIINHILKAGRAVLIGHLSLINLLVADHRARRRISELLESCQPGCANRSECMGFLLKDVTRARDGFATMLEIASSHWILSISAHFIRTSLEEWDDLVDSIAVSADKEICDMLAELQHAN